MRIRNLLIIAATQYVIRYCIIFPFLKINNFSLQMDEFHFFLLVLATLFIAAGGYVINDYFDTRTDRINRPEMIVLDRYISRRYAILFHFILSLAGIGIAFYLSVFIGLPGLVLIFIIASGLLWFYSTTYKRQFLIGNIITSFLTAMVPLLVILYEMPLLNREYGPVMIRNHSNFNYIFFWVAGFAFFAFITTLLREIIKDTEDFEGDNAMGMNTLPIVLGVGKTKIILGVLLLLFLSLLSWIFIRFIVFGPGFIDYLSAVYFLLFLLIPGIIMIFRIVRARTKRDYTVLSRLTKLIMVAGIIYAFIVRHIVLNLN